jgi:hypothetical protein
MRTVFTARYELNLCFRLSSTFKELKTWYLYKLCRRSVVLTWVERCQDYVCVRRLRRCESATHCGDIAQDDSIVTSARVRACVLERAAGGTCPELFIGVPYP